MIRRALIAAALALVIVRGAFFFVREVRSLSRLLAHGLALALVFTVAWCLLEMRADARRGRG